MLPFAILTISCLAVASYWIGRKALFYPAVVFCGIWAFDMFLLWIAGDLFFPVRTETLEIFIAGAAMFSVGSWIASLRPVQPLRHFPVMQEKVNKIITVLVWGIVVLFPFYLRWLFGLVNEQGGAVSFLLATQMGVSEVAHHSLLFTIFGTLTEVAGIVAALSFFERKGHHWRATLAILLALMMGITNGKTGPVGISLAMICLDWMQNRRIRWKLLAGMGLIATVAVVAIEFYVHVGGGTSATAGNSAGENSAAVGRQIIEYASGPMVAFDQVVRDPKVVPPGWPFYITFLRLGNRLGADVRIPDKAEFVSINKDNAQHNVYTIYWAYQDLGYAGTLLVLAVDGFVLTLIFQRALAGGRVAVFIYSSLVYGIVFSPFAEYFFTTVYFIFKLSVLCWLVYYFPARWTSVKNLFRGPVKPFLPVDGIE